MIRNRNQNGPNEKSENQSSQSNSQQKVRICPFAKEDLAERLRRLYPEQTTKNGLTYQNVLSANVAYYQQLGESAPKFPVANKYFHYFINPTGEGIPIPKFKELAAAFKLILNLGADYTYGRLTHDRPKALANYINTEIGTEAISQSDAKGEACQATLPRVIVSAPINVTPPEVTVNNEVPMPQINLPVQESNLKWLFTNIRLTSVIVLASTLLLVFAILAGAWGRFLFVDAIIATPLIASIGFVLTVQALKHYHIQMASSVSENLLDNWSDYSNSLKARLASSTPLLDLNTPMPFGIRFTKTLLNESLIWTSIVLLIAVTMYLSGPITKQGGFGSAFLSSLVICTFVWTPAIMAYLPAFGVWLARFNTTTTVSIYLGTFIALFLGAICVLLSLTTPNEIQQRGLLAVSDFLLSPFSGIAQGAYTEAGASAVCYGWALIPPARATFSLMDRQIIDSTVEVTVETRPDLSQNRLSNSEETRRKMIAVFTDYFDHNRIAALFLQPISSWGYRWLRSLRRPNQNDKSISGDKLRSSDFSTTRKRA